MLVEFMFSELLFTRSGSFLAPNFFWSISLLNVPVTLVLLVYFNVSRKMRAWEDSVGLSRVTGHRSARRFSHPCFIPIQHTISWEPGVC